MSVVARDESQSDRLNRIIDDLELQQLSDVNQLSLPVDILVPPKVCHYPPHLPINNMTYS